MNHDWISALILGVVEGITEFLPISSTGHLIIAGQLLNFNDDRGKVFEIFIQSGAILAICFEYRQRIISTLSGLSSDRLSRRLFTNVLVAFVPTAIVGFLVGKAVKLYLFNPLIVATSFILGGVIILLIERKPREAVYLSLEEINWKTAFMLGIIQTLALIPGTSRAGATIMGGLVLGLSRRTATEFSFFLAIPTLLAATAYDLYKHMHLLRLEDMQLFAFGFIAAFISAYFAIRMLIHFISNHTFMSFAWYRIIFGGIVLFTAWSGMIHWGL